MHPIGRVLEARDVEDEDHVADWVVRANGAKVAAAGLAERGARVGNDEDRVGARAGGADGVAEGVFGGLVGEEGLDVEAVALGEAAEFEESYAGGNDALSKNVSKKSEKVLKNGTK